MKSDHNTHPGPNADQQERARWMSVLAKAPDETLAEAVAQFGELPAYLWLRKPETGLAMVRARTGGSGTQFNLGEMSVTRCALRLSSGETGLAYVAGRSVRHAEWAAIFDALMQTDAKAIVQSTIIAPLEKILAVQRAETVAAAKASKVEFMTMVRGEDA
ncbi:phosphonate C-P lyase system protein PhnG [Undibacterium sp. TJN19]|uniref:phosphonate C-P lyase system protein PhnG n=1 Tax=Undibacterium sp. TJN19 TaxID=3413055 RepID=UPI003BEFDB72